MLKCVRRSGKNLNKIKVQKEFSENPPKPKKLIVKTAEFVGGKKLDPIYIDREFNLIDGYCSYLIATALDVKKVKIIQVREERNKDGEK